ncbi:DUF5320 domain-containing protein [Patescibacteria group bacterium]
MPWGDGTGPFGTGQGTGWRRGRCYNKQSAWPVWRTTRNKLSKSEELQYLDEQETVLKEQLSAVADRKKELK